VKIFADTNVLVAAFLANHPHHESARPVLEAVKRGTNEGFVAAHSLAEAYAVLTRLPGANHVAPGVAWQLLHENTVKMFGLISLTGAEYSKTLENASVNGIEGGKIYDAILLAAAAKSGAERIYTFNVGHFQRIADDGLRKLIVAP
jgi:predicted nucleic acid-binding protein